MRYCCSVMTPWTAACKASLSFTLSWSLLKLMSIELTMPSNHLILCCPPLLPSIKDPASGSFPMSHLFTSDNQSIGASASAQVLPMKSELISFRIDWFDLLGSRGLTRVFSPSPQGTLKSLLPICSLKASALQSSACFMVQLSHL